MNELERIIDTLHEASTSNERVLLATIVGVLGSTYRGIGARMAIKSDGTIAGMISGGCLEADIAARAERIWKQPRPQVITYDTDCDGLVEVLVEPLSGASLVAAEKDLTHAASLERSALGMIIGTDWPSRLPLGRRLLVKEDLVVEDDDFASIAVEIAFDAGGVIESGKPARTAYAIGEATIDVVWESIVPPLRLTICGGGADTIPMVSAAASLGWKVEVIDRRPSFAHGRRSDAIVIMSHHFEEDLEYLEAALATEASYVGILGSKARTDRLLGELAASGVRIDDATRERLFAPVGLDVGADSPEEIAVAVVAEILAARRGRCGDSLRKRHGRIHTPVSSYDLAMF